MYSSDCAGCTRRAPARSTELCGGQHKAGAVEVLMASLERCWPIALGPRVLLLTKLEEPAERPWSTSGHLLVALKKPEGMLLAGTSSRPPTCQDLARCEAANSAVAIRQSPENNGRVVGGCSFVRAFSWRRYDTRAIVGQ